MSDELKQWATFEEWLASDIVTVSSITEYARLAFNAGRATSGAASGEVQELPKACSVAADHRLMELVNAMASATTDAAYRDAHQLLVRHLDSHNARHHQIVQTLMRLNEKLAEMAASAPAPHKPAGYMTPGSSQVDPSMALPPVPPTKTK